MNRKFLMTIALSVALLCLQAQAQAPGASVKLTVLMPTAKATLTIDGKPTRQTGEKRVFVSPPVAAAKEYTYVLSAVWQPNNYTTITRVRDIPVRAGQELEVDLRQANDQRPDRIVIRYVPTPPDIVDEMVRMGKVSPQDVVYDLGCGDGRMVIAAVKAGAKRGVGVDLDPKRIEESKANAKAAGVEDRVEFRQGDVLDIKDISNANVILLYMSDALNLRLRPVLQKTLKPGSRIVSHRFTMGDWEPKEKKEVMGEDGDMYDLLMWVVGPAQK